MKKSLEILGVESSSLEEIDKIGPRKKNDSDISQELESLTEEEKESHLRKLLEKKPNGFVSSKRLLAKLVKNKDLKLAVEMIFSACLSEAVDPENYYLLAEIAFENNAWDITRKSLEITKWLNMETNLNFKDLDGLHAICLEKIKNKEHDNSQNNFWCNRNPDAFWILEKLYLHNEKEKLITYCFNLLNKYQNQIDSYEAVYKVLALSKNKEGIEKFIQYLKENVNHDKLIQNLYLGATYYLIDKPEDSIRHLLESVKIKNLYPKSLLYLALNYLMLGDTTNFIKIFERIIPETDPKFSAVYFIYSVLSNLNSEESEFPNHKVVAKEITNIFEKLSERNQQDLIYKIADQFNNLNYKKSLPFYPLYFAEMFIKQKKLEKAKALLEQCELYEVHRLKAWIERLEGNEALAEKELYEYRKNWIPEKDKGIYCKCEGLNIPEKSPKEKQEIFNVLESSYTQTKDLIIDFVTEYGLNLMTCIETGCQDCCKRTFPLATYTEYLYMREWLEKQDENFKNKIVEESKVIANYYRERYKKEPRFLIGDEGPFTKVYPLNFNFSCPFLGDNKCNAYEARPFACRAYGFSSHDGVTFKGCNYFFEQFKSVTNMHHVRKVIDATSFYKFAKDADETLIGTKIMAPLPIWFAQSHEETMKKVKEALNSTATV